VKLIMQLHQVKRNTRNKKKKIVGRGGSRGKTSGRGHKGQKARAGHSIRPQMRDTIKKIPKKRGYRFSSIRTKPTLVHLVAIEASFSSGDQVTPKLLVEKSIIRRSKGRYPKVKILSVGEISKKIIVSDCLLSKAAQEKIEKAGGTIK